MKHNVKRLDYEAEEVMYIIHAPCWNCQQQMVVAVIRGDYEKRGRSTCGPEAFSAEEVLLAKLNGANIQSNYSATMDDSYLANTCPHCNSFVGSFYLFTQYFNPAELGEYPYKSILL